jgi:hypothetical protein
LNQKVESIFAFVPFGKIYSIIGRR